MQFEVTDKAAATPEMFLGPDGTPVEARSLIGPLAAGVPGSAAGLFELHRRFGRLPWKRVVAPAIRLARRGSTVSRRLSGVIFLYRRELLQRLRMAYFDAEDYSFTLTIPHGGP